MSNISDINEIYIENTKIKEIDQTQLIAYNLFRKRRINAAMVKWYNVALPRLSREFDSPWPHTDVHRKTLPRRQCFSV